MAKNEAGSFRRGKLIRKSSSSIFGRAISKDEGTRLERIAQAQRANDDSGIDFSDMPELSSEQLKLF